MSITPTYCMYVSLEARIRYCSEQLLQEVGWESEQHQGDIRTIGFEGYTGPLPTGLAPEFLSACSRSGSAFAFVITAGLLSERLPGRPATCPGQACKYLP